MSSLLTEILISLAVIAVIGGIIGWLARAVRDDQASLHTHRALKECQERLAQAEARIRKLDTERHHQDQSALPPGRSGLRQGTLLENRYRMGRELGNGGLGVTYAAYDGVLAVDVVVKEYFPEQLATRDITTGAIVPHREFSRGYLQGMKNFLSEARQLAKLSHPNIVRVTNFFLANDTAYLVMDSEQGGSLAQRLMRHGGKLDPDHLIGLVGPILDALGYLHANNLLHGDIKPDNIVLGASDRPILIDFGTSRALNGVDYRGAFSMVSPGYAAPEQYEKDGALGPWTDFYSLGATLYQCITGVVPTEAPERVRSVAENRADPVCNLASMADASRFRAFNDTVDKMLSLTKKARPKSASEVRRCLGLSPTQSDSSTTGTRTRVVSDSERF